MRVTRLPLNMIGVQCDWCGAYAEHRINDDELACTWHLAERKARESERVHSDFPVTTLPSLDVESLRREITECSRLPDRRRKAVKEHVRILTESIQYQNDVNRGMEKTMEKAVAANRKPRRRVRPKLVASTVSTITATKGFRYTVLAPCKSQHLF